MSLYNTHIYPRLVEIMGNPRAIRELRQRIVPLAEGAVLEIGVGPGGNFVHYDAGKVSKVYALEPNPGMVRLAQKRRSLVPLEVQFIDLPGEQIPLEEGTVDTVLSTFTFCTIPALPEAIQGIRRVLKPNRRLLFVEHGVSADPKVRMWQKRWEPIHHRVFQGCHLTRDIPAFIQEGGFRIAGMDTGYLAGFPKSWGHCWWGSATPR